MPNDTPERIARAIVEACADCDICRYLMEDTPCMVFPELYRLYDKETEHRGSVTAAELRGLVELCSFCALCPCPDVRSDLMKAKSAFIQRDGLNPSIRFMEDVERVAAVCGAYPRLTNALLKSRLIGPALKKLGGIHAERDLPLFPDENFPAWARRRGLHRMGTGRGRKVAYFAGCTGQFLFPDVPRAVVEVFQRNGIEVYCPEQKCCGMPSMLEGDRGLTLELAAFNLERLGETVQAGYDIVCSCPTCGYMLKHVLSEGACHAVRNSSFSARREPYLNEPPMASQAGGRQPASTGRHIFAAHVRDEGYFASLDAEMRLEVANHTYDLGDYLLALHHSEELNTGFGPVPARMAYYAPCHLREQKIGSPWPELLNLVSGISMETIDGAFYCCGMGGIMGFKEEFHQVSLKIGSPLMEKINAIHPERILTDCLSCRLQFNHLAACRVFHPVEVLREAYAGCETR